MDSFILFNGNQLIIPNTVSIHDDKMAYFVSYLYTYPFQHREYIKSVTSLRQKNLKGEPIEIGDLKALEDKRSKGNALIFSGSSQDTGNTSYSYVFTSENYYNLWDGFIPIHRNQLVNWFSTKDYNRVKTELVDNNIITCNWSYSNFDFNRYTMKYSLSNVHRFSEPQIYELSNKRFANKLQRINKSRRTSLSPFLQKLEDKLYEFNFDDEDASYYVQNNSFKNHESKRTREMGISIMKNKPVSNFHIREGSISKRVFSPITSLPRDLRHYLNYKGQNLWDVDISCALPTLFNAYLIDLNYQDVKEYRYLTSDNNANFSLYDYLGELWEVHDREEVKKLTMVLFFGRGNTIREYRLKFNEAFPSVYNVIKKMKRKSYKIISTLLMKREREIMIDSVVNSLIKKDGEIPILTIHDGILTTEENTEKIKSRIQREIKDRIGITPKVKIKSLRE